MSKKKKTIIAVISVLFIFGVIGALTSEETEIKKQNEIALKEKEKQEAAERKEVEDAEKAGEEQKKLEEETIVVSAEDLLKEYEDNKVRADDTFKGKRLEIEGEVSNIDTFLNQKYFTLREKSSHKIGRVSCTVKDQEDIDKLIDLEKGDRVTIVGTLKGKSMSSLEIKNCKFK